MWSIRIGKSPSQYPVCSAITCRDLDEGYTISRNSESYWITERLFCIGAIVYKKTPEYDRLHAMLNDVTITNETIRDWVDRLIVRKAPGKTLMNAVRSRVSDAHRDGRHEAKQEFKDWLSSS